MKKGWLKDAFHVDDDGPVEPNEIQKKALGLF